MIFRTENEGLEKPANNYRKENRPMAKRILPFILCLVFAFQASAQTEPVAKISYDAPRTFEIGGITLSGNNQLDRSMVVLLAGFNVGDLIEIPGDKITQAIKGLWKQELFSDVKITVSNTDGNLVYLDIHLDELPRLSRYVIAGCKKSEREAIRESVKLARGKVVNENVILTTKTKVTRYFVDKGFRNVEVNVKQVRDTVETNGMILLIDVKRNKKVKIGEIYINGNTQISDFKIERTMKDTRKRSLLNIFSSKKFLEDNFEEDKKAVIAKYQTLGYRDAKIVHDTVFMNPKTGRLIVGMTIEEGNRYYFGDVTFLGNSNYTTEQLENILKIKKGDVYDVSVLESRLYASQDETDISSLYLNDGYLFFNVNPVERLAENDTIDLELRIYEGQQARINKVIISGNTRTNDHVIYREIRSKPGMLFSRSDITRTIRELATLNYFDPEQLNVNPVPNPETGTVDIEYIVVEKSTSQVELQGGWGAGRIVGTFGIIFDNFAAKQFFKKGGWNGYLPVGDGQRLAVRAQSNGLFYQNYSISFTEPWLGGKKPNSLTVSAYHSRQSNGSEDEDTKQALHVTGLSVGLGQRLKWPDDFFTIYNALNFQRYNLINDFSGLGSGLLNFENGTSDNFNLSTTLGRSSVSQPIYPRFGSSFSLTLQLTPPYSLIKQAFDEDYDVNSLEPQEKYKFLEYHKWKLDAEWYTTIVGNLVLRSSTRFGFLSFYNDDLGPPPFERFYVGGDGLSNFVLDGRETIGLRGYPNNSLTTANGGTVFSKYALELRYPVTMNPSSTIYGLVFAEGGGAWSDFASFKPFEVNRSVGMGVRVFMPFFGLLGVDFGYGLDKIPGQPEISGWQTHFIIGQQF